MAEETKTVKGYISTREENFTKAMNVQEEFKGEVDDKMIKFPKELGAEHPFDMDIIEKVYQRVSVVSGAVNKYVDHIVGDFTLKVKNPNAEAILLDFIKKTNFSTELRGWIREGVMKGNGFMEIDLKEGKIRVLNAKDMYVVRNKKGTVTGYNQFKGKKRFEINQNLKIINFTPEQIAHLKINCIAEAPYGLGQVWPNERAIESLVKNIEDKNKVIGRKAGSPIHVKVGVPGEAVNPSDIDEFKTRLQYMNNKTEWVTDANVEMSILDFRDVGKNLEDAVRGSLLMLIAGFETPEVLFGSGQLNEGIAKVQLEGWQRKIRAMQEQIESIIEEKIFKPLLNVNSFDENVEFIWNLPGEEEINRRIERLGELIKTPFISNQMRAGLEIELARLLNLQDLEKILPSPSSVQNEPPESEDEDEEPENAERNQEETQIPQPEVPGAKPAANQGYKDKKKKKVKAHEEMTIQEFVNLQEIEGFNYTDYLVRILQRVNIDNFDLLRAVSEQDILDGLFDDSEIERLRVVLKEGFRKNKTIREIERDLDSTIELRDRIVNGRVVSAAELRALMIIRTETVRLANLGLVDLYKQNNIQKVRFLAALSDRTCPICEDLNGRVFEINELEGGLNQPPIHTACRCSLISVIE